MTTKPPTKSRMVRANTIESKLLSRKDAALFVGISTWQLDKQVEIGELQVRRVKGGRKKYFHRDDLEKLIDASESIVY